MALAAPRPRGIIAIGVLLAWVASLIALGARHFGAADSESLSGEAALRIAPGDAWLAIMSGDVQVGTAGITMDTLSPGFRIQESVTLELPRDGGLVHSARFTRVVVSPTLGLQEMTTAWSRPGRKTSFSLMRNDLGMTASYQPGPSGRHFRNEEPPGVFHIFPYQLAISRGMNRGRTLTQLLIEGWPASARQSRITIGNDTTVTYPDSVFKDPATGKWQTVTTLKSGGVRITVDGVAGPYQMVTDKRGRMQGLETVLGVRWVRQNFDMAMNAFRETLDQQAPRILLAYPTLKQLAARPYPITDSTYERRFLLAHRDGTPLMPELRDLLAGGRQRIVGDTLIVVGTGNSEPVGLMERDKDFRSVDPLLGSVNDFIGPVRLIGLERHTPDAIDRLVLFLQQTVAVDTSVDAPQDALQTLTSLRGRADGVARLFVAIAQAAGLTTRYVIGVRPMGDTLYTHAWAEVRNSRGEWVAVDPARGEASASTALIRLAWGGSSFPEDMLMLLANARITPLPTSSVP